MAYKKRKRKENISRRKTMRSIFCLTVSNARVEALFLEEEKEQRKIADGIEGIEEDLIEVREALETVIYHFLTLPCDPLARTRGLSR
jgi:hypothetical protein